MGLSLARLAVELSALQDRWHWFRRRGESWSHFLEVRLGIPRGQSCYLVNTGRRANAASKKPQTLESLIALGLWKMSSVLRLRVGSQLEEWIHRAASEDGRTLAARARRKRGQLVDSIEVPRPVVFRLYPAQLENVERALSLAGEIAESKKRGHLLDLICTSFLAFTIGDIGPGEKLLINLIRMLEVVLDVNLIATERGSYYVLHGKPHLSALKQRNPKAFRQA
ncbi:hypothetical protein ACFL51_00180 [Myxococcota bacterium]